MTFTTRPREFDYLELNWLEKTTGRPSHEWDLYIVKELLDNALDADERWSREHGGAIELAVTLNYGRHQALEIAVANAAPFPVGQLERIFDLAAYTSSKSHVNEPTRGHQGNALKTMLGIPYALLHYQDGDYENFRTPLRIETGDKSYAISFAIDEQAQQVRVAPIDPAPRAEPGGGTCIRVGIDRFAQEERHSRTLLDLHGWAQRFALLNPHATFRWQARVGGEQAKWQFPSDPAWRSRFAGAAPVHWYEYAQLRELLLELERRRGAELPLGEALQAFAGFTPDEDPGGWRAAGICARLGFRSIGDLHLAADHARTLRGALLPALLGAGRKVPADRLGGLGEARIAAALAEYFALEAPPLYHRIVQDDPADPAHPFVLELALARLPAGARRVIWTGLNHTPAYEDPFYTRQLYPPGRPDAPVFGLDGFLDAYGQTAGQPALLLMHLICPNLAFQDFSKTLIETRPFREPLTAALHELLAEFNAAQAIQIEDLQPAVHALLPEAIGALSPDGRQQFASAQLLRMVRRLLAERLRNEGRAELAAAWLSEPAANTRLQGYIESYAREHPAALANLAQPERGRLALPVHPDGHTTLPLAQVDRQVLDQACVNKLLLVADSDLETIVVANRLLARFDMALLRIEGTFEASFEALLPHLDRLGLPLALLHHASAADCLLAGRLRAQLDSSGLQSLAIQDLGLTPAQGLALGVSAEPGLGGDRAALARALSDEEIALLVDQHLQISLFALPFDRLVAWLDERFAAVNLDAKFVPEQTYLREDALKMVRQTLTGWVLDRFRADFAADQAIQLLSADLDTGELIRRLGQEIGERPLQSWQALWADLTAGRCQEALAAHEGEVEQLIRTHAQQMADRQHL